MKYFVKYNKKKTTEFDNAILSLLLQEKNDKILKHKFYESQMVCVNMIMFIVVKISSSSQYHL